MNKEIKTQSNSERYNRLKKHPVYYRKEILGEKKGFLTTFLRGLGFF